MADIAAVEERARQVLEVAHGFGLDPLSVHFELAPTEVIQELQAYSFPERYSHWTFGREFRQTRIVSDFGEKDFEILISADPVRAWLDEANSLTRDTLSITRILSYADFFRNSVWISNARRDMPSTAARARRKLDEYRKLQGEDAVEDFLDAALSIAELVDPWHPVELPGEGRLPAITSMVEPEDDPSLSAGPEVLVRIRDGVPLDPGSGPPPAEAGGDTDEPDTCTILQEEQGLRDILAYIRDFSPYLKDWQRDILHIVHEESLYLWSLRRTSLLSDGWATFWQSRIVREMASRGMLDSDELFRLIVMHSQMLDVEESLGRFVAFTLLEWACDYFNGRVSEEEGDWLAANGLDRHPRYDGDLVGSPGYNELMQIRNGFNDEALVGEFFDKCAHDRIFRSLDGSQKPEEDKSQPTVWNPLMAAAKAAEEEEQEDPDRWRAVRDSLLRRVENGGVPRVVVESASNGRKDLHLRHLYDGRELEMESLEKTIQLIYTLWGEPVHMRTVLRQRPVRLTYDGVELRREEEPGADIRVIPF